MEKRGFTKPQTHKLFSDQDERLTAMSIRVGKNKSELIRMAVDALLEANGIDDAYVRRFEATRAQRIVIMPVAPRGAKALLEQRRDGNNDRLPLAA